MAPLACKVVLSWTDYVPSLLYFTKVVTVAGPYHRSEKLILAAMDAFEERDFRQSMPASFAATKARAVLVCPGDGFATGSLHQALVKGEPPPWLVERPVDPASSFRLYEVR